MIALRFAYRFVLAALSVTLGWGFQFVLYVLLVPGAGAGDVRFWMMASAWYAAAALVVIGLPLCLADPKLYTGSRQGRAILLAGGAGAAMTLLPPAVYLFFVTVPLGFACGALAMWSFSVLAGLTEGDGDP